MKSTTSKYGRGLLPTYFKPVGIAVVILAIVGMIIFRSFIMEYESQKALAKSITVNAIIIGLFLFSWSRDKVEDEMNLQLRFTSMGAAFIFGVVYCIIHPVVSLLIDGVNFDLPGQQLVMTMLLMFIFIFAMKKKAS
jgi:hypothetical protein